MKRALLWFPCVVLGCSASADPVVDKAPAGWVALPAAPIAGRSDHGAVWTGREMIVFGGEASDGPRADSAAFNPATNTWRTLPPAPIAARRKPAVIWTGHDVLVYGGVGQSDGARFDPSTNTWTRLPDAPLSARTLPAYAFAESTRELVVYGGQSEDGPRADGAALDVETNTWRTIAPSPLGARAFHRAVWTGRDVLVVGGLDGNERLAKAAATYDPVADSWTVIEGLARAEANVFRLEAGTAVLGGQRLAREDGCPVALADGALFDGREFAPIPSALAPLGAEAATWSANGKIFVFGGYRCDEVIEGGASFDTATRTWSALPSHGPTARYGATAVWTGEVALIWGGIERDGQRSNNGAAFR